MLRNDGHPPYLGGPVRLGGSRLNGLGEARGAMAASRGRRPTKISTIENLALVGGRLFALSMAQACGMKGLRGLHSKGASLISRRGTLRK